MVDLLERQNELLQNLNRLMGKLVNSEAEERTKPRRSEAQKRQLEIALRVLKKDPLHNVLAAAKHAYRSTKGYASLDSLYNILRKIWNSHAA